jgi:hypothetical protein
LGYAVLSSLAINRTLRSYFVVSSVWVIAGCVIGLTATWAYVAHRITAVATAPAQDDGVVQAIDKFRQSNATRAGICQIAPISSHC